MKIKIDASNHHNQQIKLVAEAETGILFKFIGEMGYKGWRMEVVELPEPTVARTSNGARRAAAIAAQAESIGDDGDINSA